MTGAWSFGGQPPVSGSATTTLLEGSSFCICDTSGTIESTAAMGLFVRDTRVISHWSLDLLPDPLEPLANRRIEPNEGLFLSRRTPASGDAATSVLVSQHRFIGPGMREEVEVRNVGLQPVRVLPVLRVAADFADVLDVKTGRAPDTQGVQCRIGYSSMRFERELSPSEWRGVTVTASGQPIVLPGQFMWDLEIPGGSLVTITLDVRTTVNGEELQPLMLGSGSEDRLAWAGRSRPRVQLTSSHDDLEATIEQSLVDISALRIMDPRHPGRPMVAAGAPWFMTLFGRDSLISSWMLLPFSAELAHGTLTALAESQGVTTDPITEEQPGRILHEVRSGLHSVAALRGANTYFGSADATPLFVMLVGEMSRWGCADDLIEPLMPHVDRALDWILTEGDRDGDGFVEYLHQTPDGLINQGWKDSWDGINFADGHIAEAPIALCEVQAYCYGAFVARTELAERFGDPGTADLWRQRATELKQKFNAAFWLPESGWYAVGLDRDKRPIDALASNMGHALWTGIIADEHAAEVAEHLLDPSMFTGWGIRTLATTMAQFNPVSYHNGTVWPHDSAIIAAGLMRYGFETEAVRVIEGLFDAASHFDGRLPELFCGFGRDEFAFPVPYPTACTPQAWSAAAPLLMLRTLLGLDPDVPRGQVTLKPAVPDAVLPLELRDIIVGGRSIAVSVDSQTCRVEGLADDLQLVTRT